MSRNKIFLLFFAATFSFDLDSLEEILACGRSFGSSIIPEHCITGNSNNEISLARSKRSSDDWVVQMLAPVSCESQRCQKVPLIVEKMKIEQVIGGELIDIKGDFVDFGTCAGYCKLPEAFNSMHKRSNDYKRACAPSKKKSIRIRSFRSNKIVSLKLITRNCSCEYVHFC